MDVASYPAAQASDGHRFILLAQDRFSRKVFGKPLTNNNGAEIATALRSILAEHGAPAEIVSDQGPDMQNQHVKALLGEHNVEQHFHEKSDWRVSSQLDSAIKGLKRAIALRKAHNPNWEWSQRLGEVLEGENEAPRKPLLGASAEEVDQMQNPDLHFSLEKRSAERMFRNEQTILRRAEQIRRRKGFDALLPVQKNNFRRGHEARYDDGHRVLFVEGNLVVTPDKTFQARRGRAAPPP